jgi:hypothetical protein
LRATPWRQSADPEIGMISSSPDGCLHDNQKYFRDYVASGRTLGRGSLFIYTLPTSVAAEIAIGLTLAGPCLFLGDDARPVQSLVQHAERLMSDGEADRMLALWSEPQAAVCFAVEPGDGGGDGISALLPPLASSPMQLIGELLKKVSRA